MDVARKMQELLIGFDNNRFVNTLVERSYSFILLIEINCVSCAKRLYKPIDRVRVFLFYQEMEMIGHEAICNKPNIAMEIIETQQLESSIPLFIRNIYICKALVEFVFVFGA